MHGFSDAPGVAVAHCRRAGRSAYVRGLCFASRHSEKPEAPDDRTDHCSCVGGRLPEKAARHQADEARECVIRAGGVRPELAQATHQRTPQANKVLVASLSWLVELPL